MRINLYVGLLLPASSTGSTTTTKLTVRLRDGYVVEIETVADNSCFNPVRKNPAIPVQRDGVYGFMKQKGAEWKFHPDLTIVDVKPIVGKDGVSGSETAIFAPDYSYVTVPSVVKGVPDSFSAKADKVASKRYKIVVSQLAIGPDTKLSFSATDGKRITLITKSGIGNGDRKIAAANNITLP